MSPAEGDASLTHAGITDESRPLEQRAKSVLQQRAKELARHPAAAGDERPRTDIVRFSRKAERFGIETRFVRAIVPVPDLVPVPGTPPFLCGVAAVRGEVLAVFDVPPCSATSLARGPGSRLVVCGTRVAEFALLADTVDGLMAVALASLSTTPDNPGTPGGAPIRGLTNEAVAILDGAALLAEPRFFIDHSRSEDRSLGG